MKEAAYCGTREIYDDMEMSAKSLVANGGIDKVHFIIEDSEFPRPLPEIVECHDLSGQTFFKPDGPNMKSKYTYMAMMRIALCKVLDADKVLSLDADTIVRGDLGEIWEWQIDDCYFSACPEWHRSENGLDYCNFGVVFYNLEKMRDGKADECIDVLNRKWFPWVEQDVGSYLCQGRIHKMPYTYNACYWTNKDGTRGKITHYAGVPRDKWARRMLPRKYSEMSWDEAMELHG